MKKVEREWVAVFMFIALFGVIGLGIIMAVCK